MSATRMNVRLSPRESAQRWALPALALIFLALFVLLTSEMLEADTQHMDLWVLHWAQGWRATHPGVESLMRDFSGVGSTAVLALLTAAVSGYLWLTGRLQRAVSVAAAMGAGAVAVVVIKGLIGRSRPDPGFAAFLQDGLSFPSGHATMSTVFFLTMGAILARRHARLAERAYVLAIAALLALLIGFSRMALGVHWASDVMAGWTFGAGWATLCFWIAELVRQRQAGAADLMRLRTPSSGSR